MTIASHLRCHLYLIETCHLKLKSFFKHFLLWGDNTVPSLPALGCYHVTWVSTHYVDMVHCCQYRETNPKECHTKFTVAGDEQHCDETKEDYKCSSFLLSEQCQRSPSRGYVTSAERPLLLDCTKAPFAACWLFCFCSEESLGLETSGVVTWRHPLRKKLTDSEEVWQGTVESRQ